MLTSFQDTPQFAVYIEAIELVGFSVIKDTFLASLDAMPGLTTEQQIAIRLAAIEVLWEYWGVSTLRPSGG